jgi:hypothetical protein
MQLPDLFKGTTSGPIIEGIGVILFFISKMRKEKQTTTENLG